MIEFGEGFRSRWMLEDRIAYLNHAGFGATPTAVLQAADEWRHKMEAEPVRFMEEELLPALDETARRLARFVGAKPSDLAFVDNATTGMNAVLQSLELAAGDEIVTTDHAYQAIKRTLDFVSAQRRANLKIAQIAYPVRDRVAILEAIETQFSERTRYLVIDHITSHTALRMPLREILSLAQARDIPVLVDGAHAPGNLALNLEDLSAAGLTWYVGNCHKWLCGAKSAGFLWADPKHQRTIVPPVIGNFFGDGYREAFSWPGTRDFSPWLAVSAALDFQAEIGAEKIRTYCHGLADEGAALLVARWHTERGVPREFSSAMATVALPLGGPATPEAAKEIYRRLRHEFDVEVLVVPFAGRLWARISAYLYNDISDYARLADAVDRLTK